MNKNFSSIAEVNNSGVAVAIYWGVSKMNENFVSSMIKINEHVRFM